MVFIIGVVVGAALGVLCTIAVQKIKARFSWQTTKEG